MKPQDRQIPTCQPRQNLVYFLAVTLLLALCLGVLPTSTAFACHNGKPHGPHSCGGGGGGGNETPVLGTQTLVSFIGPDYLDESSARLCTPADLTVGAGRFNCELTSPVRVSAAGMTLVTKKPNIEFCNSLVHYSTSIGVSHVGDAKPLQPNFYQYGWTDSCTDGACQIVVDLSFSGPDISTATGGKSDAVDLKVTGTLSGGSLGENPFSAAKELAMSHINMQFRKPGSTSVAAVCDWYPISVDINGPHPRMVFRSEALPPPQ